MQTSGHRYDALVILVPVGVSFVVGGILFGGPTEALQAINNIGRHVASVGKTRARARR